MATSKKHSFKLGRCYLVRFYDHASGSKNIFEIEIVGWCIENTDKHAAFTSWLVDHLDQDVVSGNYEPIALIKSAIISKKLLQTK